MTHRAGRRTCAIAAVVGLQLAARGNAGAQTKDVCARAANEAQTLRDAGKYLAARAELVTCANQACPAVVSQACRQWLAQLDADVPTVVFHVKDERGQDRADVRVSLDGKPLLDRLPGTPVPTDPGEHVLRFEAPGELAAEQKIVLHAGEKDRAVVVELQGTAPPPPKPVAAPAPAEASRAAPSGNSTARTVVALGLAGLAVGTAAAGVTFVLASHSESNSAEEVRRSIGGPPNACSLPSAPRACTDLANDVSAQHRDTNISTALFATAGGLAVGALAAWLFWPKQGAGTASGMWVPSVTPGGATLTAAWALQ